MHAAAQRKSAVRVAPSVRDVSPRPIPAPIANTKLATEIAFGVIPARVNTRARPWAQARCRVLSGRRGGAFSGITWVGFISYWSNQRIVLLSDRGRQWKSVEVSLRRMSLWLSNAAL
jgi:hypothetical protein